MRAHHYRGYGIEPCEWVSGEHAGRWAIRIVHGPTRLPYADQYCPHAITLAEAKRKIDEFVEDES
jgi:hypothetical protein